MLSQVQQIKIDDFSYPLLDDQIAKFPLEKRDDSKLLIYDNEAISHQNFSSLPELLPKGSLLVFNNTKVIHARLIFQKETGAKVEIFCLEPHTPKEHILAFQTKRSCEWKCMVGNLKKWKSGKLTLCLDNTALSISVNAEKTSSDGATQIIRFSWDGDFSFAEILDAVGELPIPPYLHRDTIEKDKETYQTVYSKVKGSVAAPTAGLHFTKSVLDGLKQKGVEMEEITLHVGAGTFRPVQTEEIGEHEMHAEFFSVSKESIVRFLKNINKIIAVGTTSVRTLESLYYVGLLLEDKQTELFIDQWMPYRLDASISTQRALENIIDYLDENQLDRLQTSTQIMIVPGYQFKLVRHIITNFHQPKSTLLLLISAYLKGSWKKVYDYAMENNFRFLSYGDSSLLMNKK